MPEFPAPIMRLVHRHRESWSNHIKRLSHELDIETPSSPEIEAFWAIAFLESLLELSVHDYGCVFGSQKSSHAEVAGLESLAPIGLVDDKQACIDGPPRVCLKARGHILWVSVPGASDTNRSEFAIEKPQRILFDPEPKLVFVGEDWAQTFDPGAMSLSGVSCGSALK